MRRMRLVILVLLFVAMVVPVNAPAAVDLCPEVLCGFKCMTHTSYRICAAGYPYLSGCVQLYEGCISMNSTNCCGSAGLF